MWGRADWGFVVICGDYGSVEREKWPVVGVVLAWNTCGFSGLAIFFGSVTEVSEGAELDGFSRGNRMYSVNVCRLPSRNFTQSIFPFPPT